MDEKVREALQKVPDAYEDFVNGYYNDLLGDEENQKKLLVFLKENPNAMTDDVMEYVDDVLLGI